MSNSKDEGSWQDLQKWFQQEYNARVQEISMRIEQRQQLVNFALIAIGGLLAFLAYGQGIVDKLGEWACTLSLVASGFFLLLALSYIKHDLQVAFNAEYIEKGIRHHLIKDGKLPTTVLGWEQFMNAKRRFPRPSWWFHALLELVNLLLLLPFALLCSFGMHFLFSHWGGQELPLSNQSPVWFQGTLALAVVVLAALLLTLSAGWVLVRAQRAISRGGKGTSLCNAHQTKLNDLSCRVAKLEACRDVLDKHSTNHPS